MKTQTTAAILLLGLVTLPCGARADDQQAQQACTNDAFAICGQFIPDRGRVAACLYSNLARVSVPCRHILARYDRSRVTRAKMTAIQ
jgi:hypothetical protein